MINQFIKENREKIYEFTMRNTRTNKNGDAVISRGDPWFYEDEWDEYFKQLIQTPVECTQQESDRGC